MTLTQEACNRVWKKIILKNLVSPTSLVVRYLSYGALENNIVAFHQLQVSSLFPSLPQFICVKKSNLKMLGTNIFMVFISFTEEVFYFVFSILVEVYFYFFTCFSKSYLHYSDAFFSKYAIMKKISLTRILFL